MGAAAANTQILKELYEQPVQKMTEHMLRNRKHPQPRRGGSMVLIQLVLVVYCPDANIIQSQNVGLVPSDVAAHGITSRIIAKKIAKAMLT